MNLFNKILLTTVTLFSINTLADSGASVNANAASKHSALAASQATKASVKVGSAVIATPLIIVGGVGSVSMHVGSALMDKAVMTEPLEITDKTITATPSPTQAMKMQERL